MVVRNARIRSLRGKTVDIGVRNGVIVRISRELGKGETELDANGKMVTESFVNPHIHMCKVYTLQMVGEEVIKSYQTPGMSDSMKAIELASEVKKRYREDWIYRNAEKALMLGLKHGVLHYRAFVDTDTKAKLEGIKALLKLKNEFKGIAEIQVVAFPQDGVIRDPGSEEYVRKAVEMGADVVGGIPWIEYTEGDMKKHIDKMFCIAKEQNRDVAMLVDDAGDPTLRTTEMLALKTIREEWNGRVAACHARAMEVYPAPYFKRLAALLRKADLGVVSDPHTGPLHAKVKELLDEGVTVALGQDDIADAYYPYGQNNMLEVAFLASHLLWTTTIKDMEQLYDMITVNAAKIMGLKRHGLKEGFEANMVILNAENTWEALQYHEPPVYVVSKGRVIVENKAETSYKI